MVGFVSRPLRDGAKALFQGLFYDNGSALLPVAPYGAATEAKQDLIAAQVARGFAPNQPAAISIPVYASGNVAGPSGSNATIIQLLPANPNRSFLKIVNRGAADADLFFAAPAAQKPQTVTLGEGDLAAAGGGGAVFDFAVPTGPVFCAASAATKIVVIEGSITTAT